jgi:hypothetical protein
MENLTMFGMKRQVIQNMDNEWTVSGDGVLVCPCGQRVEDDGKCSSGHVSPMVKKGLI